MALPKMNAVLYDLTLPYSKKKIQFRPFVVGEQKQLMIAMETKDEKQIMSAMKQAISSCTNNGIDIAALPLFELEYLFLNIRMKSVGEKTKIIMNCGECETQNEVDIDLRNTVFEQKDQMKDNTVLLTDKIAVRMNLPSLNMLQRLNDNNSEDDAQAELIFSATIECIEAILDEENEYIIDDSNKDELIEFVNSLSAEQFMKIQEWFENMPTLKLKIAHKCEKCQHDMATEIQGIANFF